MKKILMAILAISFSSLVFASGDMFVKPTSYFDGAYVGIGGGVNHTTADSSATALNDFYSQTFNATQPEFESLSIPHDLTADLGEFNAAGEVFVGYGRTANINSDHNNFYLGVEVFGKYTPIDMSASKNSAMIANKDTAPVLLGNSSMSTSLENDYTVGGALRMGYLVTPKTMIYVLAGVEAGNFEYSVASGTDYLGIFIDGANGSSFSDDTTQTKFGFMPGIGIETMITDHFSLRAQYVYTFFGDVNLLAHHTVLQVDSDIGPILANNTTDGDISDLDRGLFTIDLTYHFNGI